MEISFLRDNSFFNINSKDLIGNKSVTELISSDFLNFLVTEEIGKITTGTLSLNDPDHMWSKIFRNGMEFKLSWGYKTANYDLLSLDISKVQNRQGLTCIIQTPSGAGDSSGGTTYNVTFYGKEFLQDKIYRVFENGSYFSTIDTLMNDLNVKTKIINFENQNQKLNTENIIIQRSTSFKKLVDLSKKWKAYFSIGYLPSGDRIGIFIDSRKIDTPYVQRYLKDITQVPDSKELFHNAADRSNVENYTWTHHVGESGQGDGVSLSIVNGQAVFSRFNAETERTVTYKLNPEKIRKRFKDKSVSEVVDLTRNYLSAKEFDQVKWAFDETLSETAPQGMGFSVNTSMKGDPSLIVLKRIIFRDGFPSPLKQDGNPNSIVKFFIKKGIHNFDKASGYKLALEVADTYLLTGSFIQPERGDLIGTG